MSEASWEEEKQKNHEAIDRARKAKYKLLIIADSHDLSRRQYGVVGEFSMAPHDHEEYLTFKFVPGLECVDWDTARKAVRSLNRGDTTEEDYGRT